MPSSRGPGAAPPSPGACCASSCAAAGTRRPRSSGERAVITACALPGIPEVRAGDEPAALIARALEDPAVPDLTPDAVLVVAHKLISKAEGRTRSLSATTVTPRA